MGKVALIAHLKIPVKYTTVYREYEKSIENVGPAVTAGELFWF